MIYYDKIIKQSPWLIDKEVIHRDPHLLRLTEFPCIYHETDFIMHEFADGVYVVTGPRQIGKSTHLKMLIQEKLNITNSSNFLYFNCDLLDSKQHIVDLVEEFMEKFPNTDDRCYIMLDEITSVKDSFIAIKYLVDTGYSRKITYILTGSNTISIKKTGEYLPGRRGKGIDFIFTALP